MSGTIVAIAVMVLVLIGMLVVKKTMAASPMLQPVLFLCVALELGLVVFVFYKQLGKSSTGALERQLKIYHAKGFVAGEAIKAKASGKVLVVVNSGNKADKSMEELFKGMEKGLGAAPVVDELKTNPEIQEEATAETVNAVLAKHTDAKVIVFIGTLTEKFDRLNTGSAKVFLFDPGQADLRTLKKAIEQDKIIGVMMSKDNPPKNKEKLEKTDREIFDKRYFIIDKGNLGQYGKYFDNK